MPRVRGLASFTKQKRNFKERKRGKTFALACASGLCGGQATGDIDHFPLVLGSAWERGSRCVSYIPRMRVETVGRDRRSNTPSYLQHIWSERLRGLGILSS
jgi:hypothetical protein